MDIGVYSVSSLSNEEIALMISEKKSFKLKEVDLDFFADTVDVIEKLIEVQGLKCRVYTTGRSLALLASAYTLIGGVATGLTIAIHNIITYNPDYEIAKLYGLNSISVTYKK